jgi:hypothetical protein
MARGAQDRATAVTALAGACVLAVLAVSPGASARVIIARRDEAPTREALERIIASGLVVPSQRGSSEGVRGFVTSRSMTRESFATVFGGDRARQRWGSYKTWRDEVRVHAPERFPEIVTQRGFTAVRAFDVSTAEDAKQVPIEQPRLVQQAMVAARPVFAVALDDGRGDRVYIGVFVYDSGRWWVAPLAP